MTLQERIAQLKTESEGKTSLVLQTEPETEDNFKNGYDFGMEDILFLLRMNNINPVITNLN
ncbi:hypothetical protein KAR91_81545 [Candidatus Pacearchaeota archaeon]|nr:hypothetical protein [Candidatus Pacearchaeota archaeon]